MKALLKSEAQTVLSANLIKFSFPFSTIRPHMKSERNLIKLLFVYFNFSNKCIPKKEKNCQKKHEKAQIFPCRIQITHNNF
jgi:hypothetical protein